MATSICPRCGNSSFEIKPSKINGAKIQLSFIQCDSCGAVVGVLESYSAAIQIQQLARKLKIDLE
jgi:predicted nucleic-acid-binding Zn-ribbon protein